MTPVWWFTGLSGAGKTTLAEATATQVRARGRAALVLDGDRLRAELCRDLGFSAADRREQARRAACIAAMAADQGILTLVALVSPATADRALAREVIGPERYREIYVATPLAVCVARDPKGLYERARAGRLRELSGIDTPYEAPVDADLVVDTSNVAVTAAVAQVMTLLRRS